jgi:hypothetical protein
VHGELIRAAQEAKLLADKGKPKKAHDGPLKNALSLVYAPARGGGDTHDGENKAQTATAKCSYEQRADGAES